MRVCTAAAVAALLLAPTAHAQTTDPILTGTLRGVVRGDLSAILRDADVFLDGDSIHVRTGANGRFRLERVPLGQHWLFVRAIGYAATRRLVTIGREDPGELTIRLAPIPTVLPDIEVTAEGDLRRLMRWSRNAWGHSIGEAQILRFGEVNLSNVVRPYLKFQAVSRWDILRRSAVEASQARGRGGQAVATRRGTPAASTPSLPRPQLLGSGCPPAVSVNGEKPWGQTMIDDFPASQVAGLEIYEPKQRGGHVPADFAFYPQAVHCGLVVVWLR